MSSTLQELPPVLVVAVDVARAALARAAVGGAAAVHFLSESEAQQLRAPLAQAEFLALQNLSAWAREPTSEVGKLVSRLCSAAFEIRRGLPQADDPIARVKGALRLSALGMISNRSADVRRALADGPLETDRAFAALGDTLSWGHRLFLAIADAALRVARKQGWQDLESVAQRIAELRQAQAEFEGDYLRDHNGVRQVAALELVALYHAAKSIEVLALYVGTGEPAAAQDELELHFRRAVQAADASGIAELSVLLTWLRTASHAMARATIWHQLSAYNSKISIFKSKLVARESVAPMFELLPPQREALKEVMNIGNRALVVELPTSGGKTLLAEFRIIQTKVNFPDAWIVYLVPTRALINQVSRRLRRDLEPLGIQVEQATPALEVDVFENEIAERMEGFDVLVTTPEKLDLMLRSDALDFTKRKLGLVVLDEAHNLGDGDRGLRCELLLAMINRESPDSHFLLLSPFIPNAADLGVWLDAERSHPVRAQLSVDWTPNDRVVGLAYPEGKRRAWGLQVRSLHTSKPTLTFDGSVALGSQTDQAEPISKIKAKNRIASLAAGHLCRENGTVVLAYSPADTWVIAREIAAQLPPAPRSRRRELVQRFVRAECGDDFELAGLLDKGVAVHHAGLSPETRYLLEVLAEEDELRALVATSTLAQGVNFPISNVVFATHHKARQVGPGRWIREPLQPQEFWNMAGRAGRLQQSSIGIVLLASFTPDDAQLVRFVADNVEHLASTLEQMVRETLDLGWELDLHRLVRSDPKWSSFVQFLSHAYREVGDHARFLSETEMLLRRTFAYHRLSRDAPVLAEHLLDAAKDYAERLEEMPPGVRSLVDLTGFSPETVSRLLADKQNYALPAADWSPSTVFQTGALDTLVGALLRVSEVGLEARGRGEATVAEILGAWIRGDSLQTIATRFFAHEDDPSARLTECTRLIFQRLVHPASWGIGALQKLSGVDFSSLPARQREEVLTLPSMLFYGTPTVEGVLMRTVGVPRTVADGMGRAFLRSDLREAGSRRHLARQWLEGASEAAWEAARGPNDEMSGGDYKELWSLLRT